MSSRYIIRVRLSILFFTLLSLAVASLNSANARFAIVLRDRARSDNIDSDFQLLQSNILFSMFITAILTAATTIYGTVLAAYPRLLQEENGIFRGYIRLQTILALTTINTGGYLASRVRGFQPSFEKFGVNDSIPYYSLMYYGGVAQAVSESVLFLFAIAIYDSVAERHSNLWLILRSFQIID